MVEKMAADRLRDKRELAAELWKERDESREEAARLVDEKAGLVEKLAETERHLAAAFATPQTFVLPPN